MDKKIREALEDIFRYVGIDLALANDATLRTRLEQLIKEGNCYANRKVSKFVRL